MYAQDQMAAARKVARVLRPGGRAVLAALDVVDFRVDTLELSWPDVVIAAMFLVRKAGHVLCEQDRLVGEGRWQGMLTALTPFVTRWADDGVRRPLDYATLTAIHTANGAAVASLRLLMTVKITEALTCARPARGTAIGADGCVSGARWRGCLGWRSARPSCGGSAHQRPHPTSGPSRHPAARRRPS